MTDTATPAPPEPKSGTAEITAPDGSVYEVDYDDAPPSDAQMQALLKQLAASPPPTAPARRASVPPAPMVPLASTPAPAPAVGYQPCRKKQAVPEPPLIGGRDDTLPDFVGKAGNTQDDRGADKEAWTPEAITQARAARNWDTPESHAQEATKIDRFFADLAGGEQLHQFLGSIPRKFADDAFLNEKFDAGVGNRPFTATRERMAMMFQVPVHMILEPGEGQAYSWGGSPDARAKNREASDAYRAAETDLTPDKVWRALGMPATYDDVRIAPPLEKPSHAIAPPSLAMEGVDDYGRPINLVRDYNTPTHVEAETDQTVYPYSFTRNGEKRTWWDTEDIASPSAVDRAAQTVSRAVGSITAEDFHNLGTHGVQAMQQTADVIAPVTNAPRNLVQRAISPGLARANQQDVTADDTRTGQLGGVRKEVFSNPKRAWRSGIAAVARNDGDVRISEQVAPLAPASVAGAVYNGLTAVRQAETSSRQFARHTGIILVQAM